MIDRLFYLWRLAATGVAFAAFGIGGVGLAYIAFPVVSAVTRETAVRERRVQLLVHYAFRGFVAFLRAAGILTLRTDGLATVAASGGQLVVANHPTLLDVVLLGSVLPRMHCVVKPALWTNPFLKGVVSRAGYINSDLPIEDLIAASSKALEAGSNLLIFPEGTRTRADEAIRFQRGFANIAILTGAPVRIAVICCNPVMLTKNLPWYDIPHRRPVYRISAGACFDVSDISKDIPRSLLARRIVSDLETYYASVLADEGSGDGIEGPDYRRVESGGYLA